MVVKLVGVYSTNKIKNNEKDTTTDNAPAVLISDVSESRTWNIH